MSRLNIEHVFTSESVSEGHPDKVSDQISDAILDACLIQDPESRVACETLTTANLIVISGEITTKAVVDYETIARNVVRKIGYNDPAVNFAADTAKVMVCVHQQSPDISQGVTENEGLFKEQGAGDQGMMFGFATNETVEKMPATILYAHKIMSRLAEFRKSDPQKYHFLRPDAKSQVSIRYKKGKPFKVETVVVSHQHTPDMNIVDLSVLINSVIKEVIPAELLDKDLRLFINPTGKFEVGGPAGDTGLTGRKIIVDSYGGAGLHGGGAFSGKDPSKVDRSAAYMCRYVAKNIVAAGIAAKCEIQVAYAIGVAEPISINVNTFGSGKIEDDKLELVIRSVFSLKPAAIIRQLGLKHPGKTWCYQDTASYGHFGREQFPWEKCDRVEELKAAAAKLV